MLPLTPTISRHFAIQLCGSQSNAFLQSIHATCRLVLRRLEILSIILSMSSWPFVPREFLRFRFCSSGMRLFLYRWFWIACAMIAVISLNVVHRHVIGLQLLWIAPAFLFFMRIIVFPVLSHSFMVAVPRSRLSCCAILGCKLVRCFIQNPCTSSYPGAVQFFISWLVS